MGRAGRRGGLAAGEGWPQGRAGRRGGLAADSGAGPVFDNGPPLSPPPALPITHG